MKNMNEIIIAPVNGLNKIHTLTAIQWFENIIEKFLLNFFSFNGNLLSNNLQSNAFNFYNYFY